MKNIVQFVFTAILFFTIQSLHAQGNCLPDPNFTDPGIYPDSSIGWSQATVGVQYSQVITAIVPSDTVVLFNGNQVAVTIDSIELVGLDNLPVWLSLACEPPTCTIKGGETGCGIVKGTPPSGSAGTYKIDLITKAYGKIPGFGIPLTQTDTAEGYFTLIVNGPSGIPNVSRDPFNFIIVPNPSSGNFTLDVSSPISQEASVTVMNIIGQAIYTQQYNLSRGENKLAVNNLYIPEGNYFVTIKSGNYILTKKLYINR